MSATPAGSRFWTPPIRRRNRRCCYAARERVENLAVHAGNRPVTDALDAAFRLFGSAEFQEPGDDAKPRFVYVFSDRTPASWDNARVTDLKTHRDALPDPKPRLVYVDVGVEKPADAAVANVVAKPQAVAANRPVVLEVTVQTTGAECNGEVSCGFGDGPAERRPVILKAGDRQVVTFERRDLKPGFHQAEIQLRPFDSWKANKTRATSRFWCGSRARCSFFATSRPMRTCGTRRSRANTSAM